MPTYLERCLEEGDGSEPELERLRRLAGNSDPDAWVIEYTLPEKKQRIVDAVLRVCRCSGVLRDLTTGDWMILDRGRVLGWDKTAEGGARRLTMCREAQAEHA